MSIAGADPGFQARGARLKKLRRAEGGAKDFGVFRVKNHDFTLKNLFFFQWIRPCIVLTCTVYVYCLKMEIFCLLS
jgi:hypothetical protein